MLDITTPVQWQIKDEKYPTLMPWYTYGILEEIKKWELLDKNILELGGGWSTIYWAYYSKWVTVIETDERWLNDIREYAEMMGINNITYIHRPCNEGDQSLADYYTEIPPGKFDIVCVDSVLRHECLVKALTLPRPLIIIHDNWQQDGFVCPASEELMSPYEIHNFIQEDHTDNHGKKWATAYWELK